MTDTDQLEAGLAAVADHVQPGPEPLGQIISQGRRLRRRRRGVTLGTATVLVVVAAALGAATLHDSSPPRAAAAPEVSRADQFGNWSAAGNAVRDRRLIQAAAGVWDRHAGAAHRDVAALLAQYDTVRGAVVVLQGRDSSGHTRLAILTSVGGVAHRAELGVRVDIPALRPHVSGRGGSHHWATAGNAADDLRLVNTAVVAWDHHAGAAHRNVAVLLAQYDTAQGSVVMLQGRDSFGHARLAVLTSAPGAVHGDGLGVRVDTVDPPPGVTAIATVSDRAWGARKSYPGAAKPPFTIVLAGPAG